MTKRRFGNKIDSSFIFLSVVVVFWEGFHSTIFRHSALLGAISVYPSPFTHARIRFITAQRGTNYEHITTRTLNTRWHIKRVVGRKAQELKVATMNRFFSNSSYFFQSPLLHTRTQYYSCLEERVGSSDWGGFSSYLLSKTTTRSQSLKFVFLGWNTL